MLCLAGFLSFLPCKPCALTVILSKGHGRLWSTLFWRRSHQLRCIPLQPLCPTQLVHKFQSQMLKLMEPTSMTFQTMKNQVLTADSCSQKKITQSRPSVLHSFRDRLLLLYRSTPILLLSLSPKVNLLREHVQHPI